jgi:microcystin-dependent protein
MAPGAVSMAGSGQAHDNRSPYLTLNYVIALQGIYPSRN